MRRLLAAGLLAGLLLVPTTASGAVPNGRFAIGDSVMLGAAPNLRARGIGVDAQVSRQFEEAVSIVRQRAANHTLKRKIIIHLGTNGILIEPSQCDTIARIAGRHRKVFLVTVTGPTRYPGIRSAQNTRLRGCANRNRNTRLIGWNAYSRGHPGWFYDGMHLTPAGRTAYATLIGSQTS